jgi:hypothetical protein
MENTSKILKCGCRFCGCLCAEHSPDGIENLCAAHVDKAVFEFIESEAIRLMCTGLFAAIVLVWAAILA